jgi:hypothetical protein
MGSEALAREIGRLTVVTQECVECLGEDVVSPGMGAIEHASSRFVKTLEPSLMLYFDEVSFLFVRM